MHIDSSVDFGEIEFQSTDFERYIPILDTSLSPLKVRAKAFLDGCMKHLNKLHDQKGHSEHLAGIRTRMLDRLIIHLFDECEREVLRAVKFEESRASLLAQGGYGRGEMNVYSDVDLLFLYPKKRGAYIEMLTEKILYILWDLDLEVGYATRTVRECKKLMGEDTTIMTSLLDIRYLCGDSKLSLKLREMIDEFLAIPSTQGRLIKSKLAEKKLRITKQGDSVFVLEPNVKESAGSLRDLQLPLWIAKIQGKEGTYKALLREGLLSEDEFKVLIQARNFFWRIRNELHLKIEKKVDLLTFHRQEALAPRLGFRNDRSGILGVERFMQTYYQLAYQVLTITDKLVRRMTLEKVGVSRLLQKFKTKKVDDSFSILSGNIAVDGVGVFKKDPQKLMHLFQHVQKRGLPIHPETRDLVHSVTYLVDESFRHNPEAIGLFRSMLHEYRNLGRVLLAMHETHVLDEWLPEFKKLRCRVQHDIYHIYTIDTHSIFAVNELSKLSEGVYQGKFDFYAKVLREVKKPELLTLGLFLHDVGKGEGGQHSEKGARIANQITQRLEFSPEERQTVEFLILSHLMMPHLSQRRDLEDPELILKFARSMETVDRLNMLFLLTWADIRAVGPDAWTEWKGSLLQRLFVKAREVLSEGSLSRERLAERIQRVREQLMGRVKDHLDKEEMLNFLIQMPPRYFYVASEEDILKHFNLRRGGRNQQVVSTVHYLKDHEVNEILIYAMSTPRLFSWVTGVMRAHAANIMSAESFQTKDGSTLLIFRVTHARGPLTEESAVFQGIQKSLVGVLSGDIRIDELISSRTVPDYLKKQPVQKAQNRVVIDNDVSAYYTVIDVYAHDRLGLLYDMTRTLDELGCYVDVNKISTKVEQVTDVFYVKDIFGQKITAKAKLESIKKGLKKVLEKE